MQGQQGSASPTQPREPGTPAPMQSQRPAKHQSQPHRLHPGSRRSGEGERRGEKREGAHRKSQHYSTAQHLHPMRPPPRRSTHAASRPSIPGQTASPGERPAPGDSIPLLWSLQNPGLFLPVSRRTTAPRPPAWTPPAPGEPSHFRARPVSHETTQYLYSITYTPYPHFSLGNNLDDSPTVNELNPYLQNHIFSLTTSVFLSTLYNSPRLQSYSSSIATKKTNILIDFRPQIW